MLVEVVECSVACYSVQPGGELVFGIICAYLAECFLKAFKTDVFYIFLLGDISLYVALHSGIVAGIEYDICCLVLFERKLYEICVTQISELRASCFHGYILLLKV